MLRPPTPQPHALVSWRRVPCCSGWEEEPKAHERGQRHPGRARTAARARSTARAHCAHVSARCTPGRTGGGNEQDNRAHDHLDTMKVVTVAVHCPSTRLRVSRIARPQCSIRASPPPPHLAPHHRPLARPARGVHTVGRASGGESSSTCDTVAATATASAGVAAMWAVWASQGEALALRCAAGSVLALFIAVGCVPSPLPSARVALAS